MVGHGGSSAGSYLADPTYPILSHCASIVVTSTLRVNCLVLFSWVFCCIVLYLPCVFQLAADCHNASKELEIYDEILHSVDQQGYNLQDVHTCRTTVPGSKESAVDWINQNCKPSFKQTLANFEKRASHSDENSFPPIESLELDERAGDSGYISKTHSKELPNLNKTHNQTQNDYNDDLPPPPQLNYAEPPTPTPPRISSMDEEDVFAPREWEDQLRHSMKFIDRTQAKSERQAPVLAALSGTGYGSSNGSVSGGVGKGTSAEWDHVRQGLQQKFGADYYAGLRGDILEKVNTNTGNNKPSPQKSPPKPAPKPAAVSSSRYSNGKLCRSSFVT